MVHGLIDPLACEGATQYLVPMCTLSDVIEEHGIVLKVDVESAELMVLKGVKDEHWSRIWQVSLHVHLVLYSLYSYLLIQAF